MSDKFREPLLHDEATGLYITVAQMEFFLNRPGGPDLLRYNDREFTEYYKNCCLYNLIYDLMEENPESGEMYWDVKHEEVAFAFPANGELAKRLAEVDLWDDELEEGEDPYGLF